MSETIPHWLTKQAYLAPNRLAIELENDTCLSFLELQNESERFAKQLAGLGVTKGSHIAILSTNDVNMIIAIHALSYLGAVGVLLNARLTPEELQYQINDAEVSILLTADQLLPIGETLTVGVIKSFSEVKQLAEEQVKLQTEFHLDDPFTIIYTSGTTGFPKGVIHTYGNHWWSAIGSALNLGLDHKDKWLAVLPFFHVGGLSVFLKSVIYGMPVYLVEKFDAQAIHKAIMDHGVTMISVVTVMLQRLLELLGNNTYPASFRCMLLGGGPAPKSLLEAAKKCQVPVFQSYGMTETASQIVTLSPYDALEKLGSAGKPLFPAQLKVEAESPGQIGEIFVKGPMVTKGYFKNESANTRSFSDGWLATGDLGYMDEAGFLYVVERRTDLIISGGENIYPSEVEGVIAGMKGIREVGVVGKQDQTWGQVPIAFIVQNQEDISKEEIIQYAEKRLANYKIPKEIYFVPQLPRNASNKLVRQKLVQWLEQNNR